MPALAQDSDAPGVTCSDAPGVYTGSDDVVLQLNALRREQRETCLVLVDRLDALEVDAAAGKTSLQAVEQSVGVDLWGGLHGDLVALDSRVGDTSTQEQATADGVGGALHADLWFLIGLAAAALPAYGLYRVVMPRA